MATMNTKPRVGPLLRMLAYQQPPFAWGYAGLITERAAVDGAELPFHVPQIAPHWLQLGPYALVPDPPPNDRIGLGICKDTGVEQHILATASLDIDLYAAGLVHLPSELDMQESRAIRIARACAAYVAFASFAGPTGDGFDHAAGVSSIWSTHGIAVTRAGSQPSELARATLS
jgi:predicted amidohydrolase